MQFRQISAGPVGAYIAVVIGAECARLIAGKTKLDILLVRLSAFSAVAWLLY